MSEVSRRARRCARSRLAAPRRPCDCERRCMRTRVVRTRAADRARVIEVACIAGAWMDDSVIHTCRLAGASSRGLDHPKLFPTY